MEHMKKKKSYAHVFSVMVICSWVAVSFSAQPEIPAKDDYQVFVNNETGVTDIYYAFHKTNLSGSEVLQGGSWKIQPLDPGETKVSFIDFPALKRSEKLSDRATKITRFFISKNKQALAAVIDNQANEEQKKAVVSVRVPQKTTGYCTGSLTFFVIQQNNTLTVKISDLRKCMRSGSEDAQLARKTQAQRKQQQAEQAQQAKEARETQRHIKELAEIIKVETEAAKEAQKEVAKKKKELETVTKQLRELKKQTSSAEENAQNVVQDVIEVGIDQEAALRGKQAEAMELSRQAVLLEQQLVEARSSAELARQREEQAKQNLKAEKSKSLGARVKEQAKGAAKKLVNKIRKAGGSPSPYAALPSYDQSSTDSSVVYEPDYSTDATPPPAYY